MNRLRKKTTMRIAELHSQLHRNQVHNRIQIALQLSLSGDGLVEVVAKAIGSNNKEYIKFLAIPIVDACVSDR